ncbi:MAG: hypothetical protein ACPGUV_07415 [Polyangiales bacterium]
MGQLHRLVFVMALSAAGAAAIIIPSACIEEESCADHPDEPACKKLPVAIPDVPVTSPCTENANCAGSNASRCDTSTGACTACLTSADCDHIAGNNVCDNGLCIQCNAADDTACGNFICDKLAKQCTQVVKNTVGVCGECIDDDECNVGRVCVQLTVGTVDVGRRCLWRLDATTAGAPNGNCANVPPYSDARTVTTVNGAQAQVCALAFSTCEGASHYRTGGRGQNDDCRKPGSSPPEQDSSLCGRDDVTGDAYCQQDGGAFLCTLPCTSAKDCPAPQGGGSVQCIPKTGPDSDVPDGTMVCEL